MLEKLKEEIKAYVPFNEQEEADKVLLLDSLAAYEDLLERTNLKEHLTASSWIVSPDRTQVVLIYHNIYDSWAWTGGHADGDPNLLHVAIKEAEEECGLKVKPVTEAIFSLERLPVYAHQKKGKYVPTHMHLNVTYLLEADPQEKPTMKADENSGAQWFRVEEVKEKVTEEWFKDHIYQKLMDKVNTGY